MSSVFSKRAVFITGASTGIGQACALHLADRGFHVFAGVRKESDGQQLVAAARGDLTPLLVDVTDREQIEAAAALVREQLGEQKLAGIVNNAGIVVSGPLEFLPIEQVRRQFEVNVLGVLAATQAFLPLLRASGGGRIVTMGSVGGRMAAPFIGPYCASKFALEALCDSLRMELAPWKIPVVLIEPGSIATPIWRKSGAEASAMEQHMPPEALELYGATIGPVRRFMGAVGKRGIAPEAVAKVVEHALTASKPKTRYLVGNDAFMQALATNLPDTVRDRVILSQMTQNRPREK